MLAGRDTAYPEGLLLHEIVQRPFEFLQGLALDEGSFGTPTARFSRSSASTAALIRTFSSAVALPCVTSSAQFSQRRISVRLRPSVTACSSAVIGRAVLRVDAGRFNGDLDGRPELRRRGFGCTYVDGSGWCAASGSLRSNGDRSLNPTVFLDGQWTELD